MSKNIKHDDTNTVYFLVKDEKLLIKYNKIWSGIIKNY